MGYSVSVHAGPGEWTSLVARGDGVPGLFPQCAVFIFLLQRLHVAGQDQVSEGHINHTQL